MPEKHYGLRLTVGGAPNTPHRVGDLPGYFRPETPTPVGGDGELTVDQARKAAKAHGDALELVELTAAQVKEGRDQAAADHEAGRSGLVEARRAEPDGAEIEQVQDEAAALAGQKEE